MNGEELAEICTAGFFLYDLEHILLDVGDLHDETLAVDVSELGKCGEGLLTRNDPDR